MEILVSRHADSRLKERLGLPKSARKRMAQRAFEQGWKHSEARGKLKRYMDHCWLSHKNCENVRIYGEHLWLFSGPMLVTVFEIPKNMRGGVPK